MNNEIILALLQQDLKVKHIMYTLKIALSSNDKRLQTFDIFVSYLMAQMLEKYVKQSC